ncbi:MAG: tetratricopeptide repeat protein [Candidatus Omnitrophica bacterium]|nr:tetratricopeptide repeat protein [Candidatus Omnitrophota bacterium]
MNKKRMVYSSLLTVVIWAFGFNFYAQAQSASEYQKLKEEYDQLKKEYEHITHDRDNLRAQAQYLLKYKEEIISAQKEKEKIDAERAQWDMERETLKGMLKKAEADKELLKAQMEDMGIVKFKMEEEKEEIKKTLSKAKARYIIIDDLKSRINDLQAENRRLIEDNRRWEKQANKADDRLEEAKLKSNILRGQIRQLKVKYNDALRQNGILVKKLEDQPREYAEISRENKVLIKRTALMHYNLGVFYTKNKEYARAAAEFEKTIELNPEDTYAYFNLGYIYAEYYVDRPKAIDYFKKYLDLAKKDDKDVDWVKKYIVTWQTWEGKDALK